MTFEELRQKIIKLNPSEIIDCGLDGFSPYAYFDWSKEMMKDIDALSDEDKEKFYDWEQEQLSELPNSGKWEES